MGVLNSSHFGMNIVLTNDSAKPGSPFSGKLSEVTFSHFRYPGGGVTEDQTWANGGLRRMFGDPMPEGSENYVMTLREALALAETHDTTLTVVIPTFQFFDTETQTFRHGAFNRYLTELENALTEGDKLRVTSFEIGNEYWASISASDYGKIANFQIPRLVSLNDRLSSHFGDDFVRPDIGIQAGAAWRPSGSRESAEIAAQISMPNRAFVDVIYQHAYPNPYKDLDSEMEGALKPAKVFASLPGFSRDLDISLSEFNMGIHAGPQPFYGVNQATLWIEELSRYVDNGVGRIDHWGGTYKWLTSKMYDAKFPPAESDGGLITAKATPFGQIFDIASSSLIGMRTMSDGDATADIGLRGRFSVTGFQSETQRVVFLGNMTEGSNRFDLDAIAPGKHVSIRHLIPADSPHSDWYDESTVHLTDPTRIVDARGDMKVISGTDLRGSFTLRPNELAVVTISDRGQDLVLEGAHNVTDHRTGMVNDLLKGGLGNDLLMGHVGDDTLMGVAGRNVLVAGAGDDLLIGGRGSDVFISQRGNDSIVTGNGQSLVLIDGSGPDVVTVDASKGSAVILTGGERDVIVSGFKQGDLLGFGGAFERAEDMRAASHVEDGNLIITSPEGRTVTLMEGANLIDRLPAMNFDLLSNAKGKALVASFIDPMNVKQLPVAHPGLKALLPMDSDWLPRLETLMDARMPVVEPEPGDLGVPTRPTDPDDRDNGDDDQEDPQQEDGSGGGCFVATAAFGNRLHPDVVALRAFRDRHLCRYRAGRVFIRFYWWIGPKLARKVAPSHWSGRASRRILSALVRRLDAAGLCGNGRC